jgi:hypothetical protein
LPERDVHPGERGDDERGRQDEAPTRDDKPRPARDAVADVDRHLGRVRAGDQVGRADEVEELGVRQPPAPPDDLVLHQRDVRRRPAEAGRAQPQEQGRDRLQWDADPLRVLARLWRFGHP